MVIVDLDCDDSNLNQSIPSNLLKHKSEPDKPKSEIMKQTNQWF